MPDEFERLTTAARVRVGDALLFVLPADHVVSREEADALLAELARRLPQVKSVIVSGVERIVHVERVHRPLAVARARRVARG